MSSASPSNPAATPTAPVTALVLVDIQRDYFPGGRMALPDADSAGRRAADVLARCRAASMPIIHIRHESIRPGSTFFLPGTEGADIHPLVVPLPGEAVLTKHFPNSFRDTELLDRLRAIGVTDLIVVGMMTHMCIDTTVRAAFDLGFRCRVAGDATASPALAYGGMQVDADTVRTAFLAALNGVFAEVTNAAELTV
ncbi:cysteine hydrolase family protein [Nitratidesulfovibrio liaohensis]|uniref:Cysteine hydrolase n=1 Tax=Nitratidesulfovibrio liaohensis TaxID=2604158 RepID=A0ABY9QYZ2_9BACT|nr:cysteine hydrolase family protein [Nitratidesulfovibrio liaohensis]WMW64562.1 cysteine hydrolase [Nitratidesulfovibrio liaohensis]